MSLFFRCFLPFTYWRWSRVNTGILISYHIILEWIPAVFLSLIYNDFNYKILGVVLLSYLAFISIYEIGYLINDFFSEKFETDPRGRSESSEGKILPVYLLIFIRILFFLFFSFWLGTLNSLMWWTFYSALFITFIFHNIRLKEHRISSFFNLAIFRFTAPLILCLPETIFLLLLILVAINYSLFRLITYGANKEMFLIPNREAINYKITYYINCLPICIFLSVAFSSFLPVGFCIYFMLIWVLYSRLKN